MENEIKNGGPAFPGHNPNYDGNWDNRSTVGGMTLRDYFAAKALPVCMEFGGEIAKAHGEPLDSAVLKVALCADAYAWADAMLAARDGKV